MTSRALPILALFAAIGIFFIYVHPLWTGPIAKTKSAIVSDIETLRAADDYLAKQSQLASARSAINPEDLKRLETFLPNSVNNVGLILDINALAARSGLALSNVDIANGTSGATAREALTEDATLPGTRQSLVNSVDLALTAIGTYPALQTFLKGIEKSARLLDVRDITVEGSNTGVYTYQMDVRLYWLR